MSKANMPGIMKLSRHTSLILLAALVIGCSVLAEQQLNEKWGKPSVKHRVLPTSASASIPDYHRDIQPILESRCVVCHACYDAPCQLKLSSFEGLERGASKELVYDGTRILAAEPSRLLIDAKSTLAWRQRDYFPVLNEREQSAQANRLGSTLYRMLKLKQAHPLPKQALLPPEIELGLKRDQQCASIENFASFEKDYPLWGMPYGLPEIDARSFSTLEAWITAGSPATPYAPVSEPLVRRIEYWEQFFNQFDSKSQLVSRYIFEHLFLADLYFEGVNEQQFFKLVRSRTSSGQPIDEIASRRPYDHPGVDQFYYRLRPVHSSRVAKTHMPYALSGARMKRWKELFFEPDYTVLNLPSYSPRVASNPFLAFKALPAKSRYQFMLDEAHYTIMAYIKGPVCRGQVSLNVIEDQFWVMFVDPDVEQMLYESDIREDQLENLSLPAESESNALPTEVWTNYSKLQAAHLQDKLDYINQRYPSGIDASLDMIWDGDGHNDNAALTVFRHFDAATVLKGFQGDKPKTAWLITYSLLERIHYLLVAGFDVHGNVGHQLNTRLYMDFLRMEGETSFLMLLPPTSAKKELRHWYRGAEEETEFYLDLLSRSGIRAEGIDYQSKQHKVELFDKVKAHLGTAVLNNERDQKLRDHIAASDQLEVIRTLSQARGKPLQWLPELSYVKVTHPNANRVDFYSLLVNRAHANVSGLLLEETRLIPEEDTLSILPGIVGAYPNAFYSVSADKLPDFAAAMAKLDSEQAYSRMKNTFGIRRTAPDFWRFADELHAWFEAHQPREYGLLDFNRLENR